MNALIEEIFRTGKVSDAAGEARDAFPVSPTRADIDALYGIVRAIQARDTIEIGMAFGVSTLAICQGVMENGGGRHSAIDPWQSRWYANIGLTNAERAGFAPMLRTWEAPSYAVLPQLLADGEQFDFAFVDGNHRFEYVLLDCFYLDHMLRTGGRLVLHDPWMPAARKVIAFLLRQRGGMYRLSHEHLGPPLPLWRGVWNAARAIASDPYDLYAARFFARKNFPNYCVLEKTAGHDPEWFDAHWSFYRSF